MTRKCLLFIHSKDNTILLCIYHGQHFENHHRIYQCLETVIILACVWHYNYLLVMIDQNQQHDGKIGFNTGGDRQFWIINILSISRTIYIIMKDRICFPEGWRPPRKILSWHSIMLTIIVQIIYQMCAYHSRRNDSIFRGSTSQYEAPWVYGQGLGDNMSLQSDHLNEVCLSRGEYYSS